MRPSQPESCSHLPPVDVESSDKDLDKYVTAAKHKYWCSSGAPLTLCVKYDECGCVCVCVCVCVLSCLSHLVLEDMPTA